jgi:hypothetical protein
MAQHKNRYDCELNGVQVVAGSNPATPISACPTLICHRTRAISLRDTQQECEIAHCMK